MLRFVRARKTLDSAGAPLPAASVQSARFKDWTTKGMTKYLVADAKGLRDLTYKYQLERASDDLDLSEVGGIDTIHDWITALARKLECKFSKKNTVFE